MNLKREESAKPVTAEGKPRAAILPLPPKTSPHDPRAEFYTKVFNELGSGTFTENLVNVFCVSCIISRSLG